MTRDRISRESGRRWGKRGAMLSLLLIIIASWVGFIWFFQRSMIYPRMRLAGAGLHGSALPADAVRIDLSIPGGTVEGVFLPGRGVSVAHPGPVVMFAHGNGELIDDWIGAFNGYRRHGVSVFLGEYRGYGRSAGGPSQHGIVSDFARFYDDLAARKDVDPKRIVFHGRSLGGGVVAQLARVRKPSAIILQSTFTSLAAVAGRFAVPFFLVRDPYPVLPVIKSFPGPVLIIGGTEDRVLSPDYSRRLHAAAPQSELAMFRMGHNDPPPEPAYWDTVIGFLKRGGII